MIKVIAFPLIFLMTVTLFAGDFHTKRELSLDAGNIDELDIDCGSGFLKVEGEKGLDQIMVEAEIKISASDEDEFNTILDKFMILTLEKRGNKARLEAGFDHGKSFLRQLFDGGFNGSIDLTVKVPYKIDLQIDDGSGFCKIRNLDGDLNIDDGSGELEIENVTGEVKIDDGSGELEIRNCGSVKVDDGTGEIHIENIDGSVWVDDGSGEMVIKDVKGDVEVDDGSGDIEIRHVGGDVTIIDGGSGGVHISDVEGKVYREDEDD